MPQIMSSSSEKNGKLHQDGKVEGQGSSALGQASLGRPCYSPDGGQVEGEVKSEEVTGCSCR